MATPLATVSLYWPAMHPPLRWAFVRAVVAWAQFIPVSEGTATAGGPMDGTTDRVAPCLSTLPGLGLWEMMTPFPTVIDFCAVLDVQREMVLGRRRSGLIDRETGQGRDRVGRGEQLVVHGDHGSGRQGEDQHHGRDDPGQLAAAPAPDGDDRAVRRLPPHGRGPSRARRRRSRPVPPWSPPGRAWCRVSPPGVRPRSARTPEERGTR